MIKLVDFYQNNLKCLKSGEGLSLLDTNSETHFKLSKAFNNIFNKNVECFMANESFSAFYPVCSNVLIFIEGYYFNDKADICGEGLLNPFSIIEDNDSEWYEDYDNVVDFKRKEIRSNIKGDNLIKKNLVEHMSSSGALIKFLKNDFGDDFENYIATDLDFYALKELNDKDKDIICICCDSTTSIFKEGTISIATSNSVHHVPLLTDNFYTNVYRSLDTNGKFVGVESQGLLAKIVIYAIAFLPKWIIPYTFKEIHTEQKLLKSWNSLSIFRRLNMLPPELLTIKRLPFHVVYSFIKK